MDRLVAGWLQRGIERVGVRLELWDGSSPYAGPPGAVVGDIVLHERRALLALALNPELLVGEAYTSGRLDVRGPIDEAMEALAFPNTPGRSRQNVQHHYDLGNSFYTTWLDREMVYTCAYFADPGMSLEDAQRAKHDLVCRKLRLRPGETVVEAGCGWGALALHIARVYGARVRAFNISNEQLAHARERARAEGLAHLVEFVEDDWEVRRVRRAPARCGSRAGTSWSWTGPASRATRCAPGGLLRRCFRSSA